MTEDIPATATLNGTKWYFSACSACGGDGRRRGVRVPIGPGERELCLDCRSCRGLGYIRVTGEPPRRNGVKISAKKP